VDDAFEHRVNVRYLEVDRQGVVFNAWYLAYFDDALTAFLVHRGLPYEALMATGHDVQLVHTELDWTGALGFGDDATVAVTVDHVGTTSFTLRFEVRRAGTPVCVGRTVYVCIALDGTGKRPLTDALRAALGTV
jgi:acyl-CoA thioester hydrolase